MNIVASLTPFSNNNQNPFTFISGENKEANLRSDLSAFDYPEQNSASFINFKSDNNKIEAPAINAGDDSHVATDESKIMAPLDNNKRCPSPDTNEKTVDANNEVSAKLSTSCEPSDESEQIIESENDSVIICSSKKASIVELDTNTPKSTNNPKDIASPAIFKHSTSVEQTSEHYGSPLSSAADVKVVKRGNRRQRCQHSSMRKWRHVEVEEMGFHISSFPRLPCTLDESSSVQSEDTLTSSSDESTAVDADLNNAASVSESIDVSEKRSVSTSASNEHEIEGNGQEITISHNDLDDETYFATLGVDITNDGDEHNCEEDVLQWDGVRVFDTPYAPVHSGQHPRPTHSNDANVSDKRPSCSDKSNSKDKHANTFYTCGKKMNKYVSNMSKSDIGLLFDFSCASSGKTYLRLDKHRKNMKSHKAVKTKHARLSDIFDNNQKKKLYMHHRLIKRHNIDIDCLDHYPHRTRQPTGMHKGVDLEWTKGVRVKECKGFSPKTKPQNLHHVLHETNVPRDIELDLVSFLFSVQNRDMTPEDYEMLLRLDDTVKAKTVSVNVLESLKTEQIGDEGLDSMCAICMEPYIAGQIRKFLPCEHDFHNDCITTWLTNSSQNCPLDGLPLTSS